MANKRILKIMASYKYLCIFLILLTSLKVTIILLLFDMVRCKSLFFSKIHWYLKTVNTSYIPSNVLLNIWKYLINQNKKLHFIKLNICNLQLFYMKKSWKLSSSFFSASILLFSRIFFIVIFHYNILLCFQKVSV